MGRLRHSAPVFSLALLFLAMSGCGGGSYSIPPPPPPPPQPDFSIGFSQNSVSVLQGATSQAVNLFVNPLNGFTGSVQVTLSGLPSGVVSSPASPFSITVGSSTPVLFSAAPNASTGSSIPGASSADLSSDGASVWIGTVTEQVAAIDTSSLQIKARYGISGLQPLPNTLFDRPEELLALSGGKLVMRLRQSQSSEALLALWTPSSNSLANLTSTEPQLFQDGLGPMARTGDQSKLLVAASDASGEIAVYDSNGNVLAGPHGLGNGTIPLVAANPDGSRFAVVFVSNGSAQVLLLDGSLNPAGTYSTSAVNGLVFSRDGQFLYVSENSAAPPIITALDGHTLNAIGQVPDLWIAGRRTEIEEIDNTKLLFGVANRGFSFVDAATPASLPATVPVFAAPPAARPSEGPVTGVTLHPSGSLLYQPFLTGPAGNAGVKGGIDILDAHTGFLRLRILLPQQFMTAADALHGSFLTIDENGQRLFALTSQDGTAQNAGITVVTLANVPLGIGTLTPANGPAAGGTTLTIRGSGFAAGATVSIGGKSVSVTFKDMNTLTVVTPPLSGLAVHLFSSQRLPPLLQEENSFLTKYPCFSSYGM
jgi:hypothetical protein